MYRTKSTLKSCWLYKSVHNTSFNSFLIASSTCIHRSAHMHAAHTHFHACTHSHGCILPVSAFFSVWNCFYLNDFCCVPVMLAVFLSCRQPKARMQKKGKLHVHSGSCYFPSSSAVSLRLLCTVRYRWEGWVPQCQYTVGSPVSVHCCCSNVSALFQSVGWAILSVQKQMSFVQICWNNLYIRYSLWVHLSIVCYSY